MIILIHNKGLLKKVKFLDGKEVKLDTDKINVALFGLAEKFEFTKIVWCHEELEIFIDTNKINEATTNSPQMQSFETSNFIISDDIGFVDQSPFINVNSSVKYPTWRMSTDVGWIFSEDLVLFKDLLKFNLSFEELLNYISKKGMSRGLLCYSNPVLLKNGFPKLQKEILSKGELLKFIKSNYKTVWRYLFVLNSLLYDKKILFFSFLSSIFMSKVKLSREQNFRAPGIKNSLNSITLDVIIPTLGRATYLKDVLIDLSKQTVLPSNVVIIEQNENKNAQTELDYIYEQEWPFKIKHSLIHQLGACNARNLALSKVISDYVFFADDDVRLDSKLIESSLKFMKSTLINAITISCLKKEEKEKYTFSFQTTNFGSGCSIVKTKSLDNVSFDLALENGFGEDADFGMQLRNAGTDIVFYPFRTIIHLKAPSGGFRKKVNLKWSGELIQPKPSPTIMVHLLKNYTRFQLKGYKTLLFIKFFKKHPILNPLKYLRVMNRAWDNSMHWAKILLRSNEI